MPYQKGNTHMSEATVIFVTWSTADTSYSARA